MVPHAGRSALVNEDPLSTSPLGPGGQKSYGAERVYGGLISKTFVISRLCAILQLCL